MNTSIDAFYAVYLTGAAGLSLALIALLNGRIIGVDATGVKISGSYTTEEAAGHRVRAKVALPANTPLIQGVVTGPQADLYEVEFNLPPDFLERDYIRVETKYGPLNARFVRLGDFDE